jgi:PST family polysaccharide transporter
MITFGLHTFGYWGANYATRNLDNLLVALCYGSLSLGSYKKAYDLFALPANQLSVPLTDVAVASLSRLRDDPEKYRRNYVKALSLLAFTGAGLSAILTLAGKDLVRLVLGAQWDEAGRIFTYFAPGIGIMMLYNTNGWLHLSTGRADRWFRWGMIEMVTTCVLFAVGLSFGPRGVAVAWTASFCLLLGPGLSYAGLPIGLSFSSVFSAVWKYAVSAFGAGLLCWTLLNWVEPSASYFRELSSAIRVMVFGCSFTLMYVTLLLLFPFSSTFGPIIDVLKTFRRE